MRAAVVSWSGRSERRGRAAARDAASTKRSRVQSGRVRLRLATGRTLTTTLETEAAGGRRECVVGACHAAWHARCPWSAPCWRLFDWCCRRCRATPPGPTRRRRLFAEIARQLGCRVFAVGSPPDVWFSRSFPFSVGLFACPHVGSWGCPARNSYSYSNMINKYGRTRFTRLCFSRVQVT